MGWVPGSTPEPGESGHAMIGGWWFPPKPTPTAAKKKKEKRLKKGAYRKGSVSKSSGSRGGSFGATIRRLGVLVGGAHKRGS